MGIKGLLPFIKDIQQNSDVKKFKGEVVGVDTYCWLHRGSYSCAKDLVLGEPTERHIQFVMNRVKLLLKHNITPIMVFDGGRLPAKNETNQKRSEMRKENKKIAMELLAKGEKTKAFEYFQRCVSITPEMASDVIQACKKMGVSCVVAPYEADAQLAHLFRQKVISLAISEDTDLLVFGCDRVFYKMDSDGRGVLVDMNRLSKLKLFNKVSPSVERDLFRHLCILSGCDYLPNLRGIGMKTAHTLLKNNNNVFELIKDIRSKKGSEIVYQSYEQDFKHAESMFLKQLVYDLRKCVLVEIGTGKQHESLYSDENLYGREQILQIVLGNINPISNKVMAHNKLEDFPLLLKLADSECHKLFELQPNVHSIIHTTKSSDNVLKRSRVHSNRKKLTSKYFSASQNDILEPSKLNNKQPKISEITLSDSISMSSQGSIALTAETESDLFTPPSRSLKYSGNFSWSSSIQSSSQKSQELITIEDDNSEDCENLHKSKQALI